VKMIYIVMRSVRKERESLRGGEWEKAKVKAEVEVEKMLHGAGCRVHGVGK